MSRTCLLHIGHLKTGTTALQNYLGSQRLLLRKHGILYPKCLGEFNHLKIARYAQDKATIDGPRMLHGIHSEDDVIAFRQAVEQEFREEVESSGCDFVIISNEHMASRLIRVEEISFLREFLSNFFDSFIILVYLRSQDSFHKSLSSSAVKMGATEIFSSDPTEFSPNYLYIYDYAALLGQWSEVFGKDAMRVGIFDKNTLTKGDIVEDFKQRLGFTFLPENALAPENKTLGTTKAQFLAHLNSHILVQSDPYLDLLRQQIVDAIEDANLDEPGGLNNADHDFLDYFAESNSRVARDYFNGEPLFPRAERAFEDDRPSDSRLNDFAFLAAEVIKKVVAADFTRFSVFREMTGLSNDYAELEACLSIALLRPAESSLYQRLGELFAKISDFDCSEISLRRASEIQPNNPEVHLLHSQVMSRQGQLKQALETAKRAALLKDESPEINLHLGKTYLLCGNMEKAVHALQNTLLLRDDDDEANFLIGMALAKQADLHGAIDHLKKAVQLAPKEALYYHNLGVACLNAGRLEEAKEACTNAVRLAPDQPEYKTALNQTVMLTIRARKDNPV